MMNKHLMDRAMRGRDNDRVTDGRNRYGSAGGYVSEQKPNRSDREYRENDSRRDYGSDQHYEMYGIGEIRPMKDYEDQARGGRGRDYNDYANYDRDYADYKRYKDYRDYAEEDNKYQQKLKEVSEKLKKKDRFGWDKEQVAKQAKQMEVEFGKEFNEMEFYVVYLLMLNEYPKVAAEPRIYLEMAKNWLTSESSKLKGSEKLSKYIYCIVLGEE